MTLAGALPGRWWVHFEADEARGFGGVVRASRNYRSSNDGGGPHRAVCQRAGPLVDLANS
jgi:hypothetical protein